MFGLSERTIKKICEPRDWEINTHKNRDFTEYINDKTANKSIYDLKERRKQYDNT